MKLLILSDSHGEQEFMQLAVRRERPTVLRRNSAACRS